MGFQQPHISRVLAGLALGLGSVTILLWWTPDELRGALETHGPTAALLAVLAGICGALAARRSRTRPVRLAMTPIVCALLLLPSPLSWAVMGVAALVGLGRGIAGRDHLGPLQIGILLASSSITASLLQALPWSLAIEAPAGLLRVMPPFLIFLVSTLVLGTLAGLLPGRPLPAFEGAAARRIMFEAINAPAAWVLARSLVIGEWGVAAAISVLIIGAQIVLAQLSRTETAWRKANGQLTDRVSELDTLHAIGREIVSSLNPQRVFRIVDRETRKIFDVDFVVIALAGQDESSLKTAYRRGHERTADIGSQPVLGGPMLWVADEKRARRIDDLGRESPGSRFPKELTRSGMQSAVTVPLIVEDRVIGVISLQSEKVGCFDDHQMNLLTTIAQQAAIAIENARHYQLATVDSLTGFFVRDHFFNRLEEEFQRVGRYGGSFTLLMVDMDGFKSINDRYGHLAGDRYLHAIAETIRNELRAADICCRYGGDEFCFLLPETNLDAAKTIAERIRTAVSEKIVGDQGAVLRATVSIGLATYPDHPAEDLHGLLRNADEALYRAKRAGRDRVVPFAA